MGGMPDRSESQALHPLLATRWSPTAFDDSREEDWSTVELLLEAARWAPSAGNSQPWAFIVGLRGDAVHDRLVRHLARSSGRWAPGAGILIANLSHRLVEGTDWDYSEFAHYDLGQAVAHLTVQARALGLSVRQFRAFDRDAVAAEFAVPAHWEVTTMCAVGRVPEGPNGPVGEIVRDRRPLGDLLWPTAAEGRPDRG
jgi:nitroreductase